MAESNELFTEVAKIRDELEEQASMIEALVRNAGPLREDILERLGRDHVLAEIYRLVDGSRSQGQIQHELETRGLRGTSQANVSRKLDVLAHDLDLILLVRQVASGKVYRRTRLGRVLKIDRAVDRGELPAE
jgi:hypothetical protein